MSKNRFFYSRFDYMVLERNNPPKFILCDCGILVPYYKYDRHRKIFHTYPDGSFIIEDYKKAKKFRDLMLRRKPKKKRR